MAHAASTTSWRGEQRGVAAHRVAEQALVGVHAVLSPCSGCSTTDSSTGSPIMPSPGCLARAPMRDHHLGLKPEAHVVAHARAPARVNTTGGGCFSSTITSVQVIGQALAGAHVERHALPAPRIDVSRSAA